MLIHYFSVDTLPIVFLGRPHIHLGMLQRNDSSAFSQRYLGIDGSEFQRRNSSVTWSIGLSEDVSWMNVLTLFLTDGQSFIELSQLNSFELSPIELSDLMSLEFKESNKSSQLTTDHGTEYTISKTNIYQ